MKLAIVRQRYDANGSAERIVALALPVLERAGAQVTLIGRGERGWGARRMLRVDPFYLGRLGRERSFARAARRAWQREGFELVQSHEPIPGCEVYHPDEGVHRRALEIRRAGASFLERIGLALSPYRRYLCRTERALFEHPRLRAVICGSHMVRDEVRRAYRISPDKLHVIYDGVDLEHFHPREAERLRWGARAEMGCRPRDTVFLFAGGDFAHQGLEAAIDALAQAGQGNYWLLVAGEDPGARRFARRARAKGVEARVRFLGRRDELRPLYAAADALLLPSRYEPRAQTALEALAMGVPAILSRRCAGAELIEPGVSGWLCEPDDPAGIARALRAADEAAGDERASRAARAGAERYGVEAMTRRLTDLYAALQGSR